MGDSAHTTHHTNPGEKPAPPLGLFVKDENIFSKIGSRGCTRNCNKSATTRADFFKNVLIFEKKGGADAFENDPPFISKHTVPFST